MNEDQRFNALRKQLLGARLPNTEIGKHRWSDHDQLNTRIVLALHNADCLTYDDAAKLLRQRDLPPNFGKKCWLAVYDNLSALNKI
jgi:hypothetical protein